jgi:hypothetical protein
MIIRNNVLRSLVQLDLLSVVWFLYSTGVVAMTRDMYATLSTLSKQPATLKYPCRKFAIIILSTLFSASLR